MTRFLFSFFAMLFIYSGFSQQIQGKVLSKKTNTGVFNVAVKTDKNIGTVTNEKGEFSLDIYDVESLTFSSLAYQTKTISIRKLKEKKCIVYLVENVNLLDEVKITALPLNLDTLLLKTQKNMRLLYVKDDALQQSFYSYSQQIVKPTKASKVELKRTNLLSRKQTKLARAELDSLSKKYADKPGRITEEFFVTKKPAQLKDNKKKIVAKVESVSGYKNNYIDATISVDEMDAIFKKTLLKYLDTTKTYKAKSGLFTIDKEVSYQKITEMKDSVENDNTFKIGYALTHHVKAKNHAKFFFKDDESNFLSRKYYNHVIGESFYQNDKKLYFVSFSPKKNKSKFSGELLINADDFLIEKINYKYALDKRGQHINLKLLLGVKFSENEKEVRIDYKKDKSNNVFVKYFKETKRSYAYISRPLSFTERKGWFEKKDKVKVDFTFEVNITENRELFYKNQSILPKDELETTTKETNKKKITFLNEIDYKNQSWSNKKLIEAYLSNTD